MSEEEKKAIEYWKNIRDTHIAGFEGHRNAIVLLNLIEKQNNRLEQLEKELEPIHKTGIPAEVLVAEWERLEDLEDDTDCLKYRIKELEKENEKKVKRLDKQFKLLEKRDKEIEELKADNKHQWEERCKLTFEFERLEKENKRLKRVIEDRDKWIETLEEEGNY